MYIHMYVEINRYVYMYVQQKIQIIIYIYIYSCICVCVCSSKLQSKGVEVRLEGRLRCTVTRFFSQMAVCYWRTLGPLICSS